MDKLLWFDNWGVGYYPVTDTPYDKDYWEKYIGYEQTEIGKRLNNHRTNLVNFYTASQLVDIGVGSGMFIKEFDDALGLDINPCAVQWLKEKDRLWDKTPIGCMTFWDSLEHIHNPTELLSMATDFVFVSCPIYTDRNHVLRSKHFRPDEHCWYFTYDGAVSFMRNFGFYLVEYNRMEEDCGREDIGTFVFKRLK